MPDSSTLLGTAPAVQRAQDWLRAHEEELLSDLVRMLRIPSLEGDSEPNAPFGKPVRDALDLALSIADSWGMKTKDLEGYAGYADFGSGERLVVALGHLDVVPVGDGWKHGPFGAEVDEGYVYARGSTDDKGPTMAMFYAARALQETCPDIPARIRMVFGCNEESGMLCVKRYSETEEQPTLGVAPDAGWPLIHGEKGIANLTILAIPPDGDFKLIEACGGQRPNIVIDKCFGRVYVSPAAKKETDEKLTDSWDKNLSFAWESPEVLRVDARGKASHGAYPHGGDSAAIRLFRFLREIAPLPVKEFYQALFDATHIGGVGLGIAGADEPSGDLTSNLGIVSTDNGSISLLANVRYPVTWTGAQLREKCEEHLGKLKGGWKLVKMTDSPPLYFPLDHPLVKAICEVYKEETGEDKEPETMGGGTYARMMTNTVAIGTGWEGDGNAHETDERLKIENLFKMSRIYAHVLYRLATMRV